MIYHFSNFEENSQFIIHTLNIDVLVTALGCLEHIRESINVQFEVGLYAKNSLRLKTPEKDKTAQTVLGNMGLSDVVKEEGFKVIEKFVYTLYGN